MNEQKYLIPQVFSAVVSVVLVFVFFLILVAGMITRQNFISELILIVIAIILLAIFTVLNELNVDLKGGKKK